MKEDTVWAVCTVFLYLVKFRITTNSLQLTFKIAGINNMKKKWEVFFQCCPRDFFLKEKNQNYT